VSPITDESCLLKNAGRPKGTTCAAKANCNSIIKKAITDTAVLFDKLKKEAERNKTNVNQGALAKIVSDIENKRGIPLNTIPLKTICTWVLRNNVDGKKLSSVSPLALIKKVLVEYCIRLAHICRALNKDQVLSLTKDVIHGTCLVQNFASFKQQSKLSTIYHNKKRNQ
jgi:hypothetical protein